MPGTAVLTLCAVILFAGYIAAILRPVGPLTTASMVSPAVPVTETVEP